MFQSNVPILEMSEFPYNIVSDKSRAASMQQESLANAKVNARQHCISLSCLCNSLTQIKWVADFSLGDEDSENIASKRYENRHLKRPLSCLMLHISRTLQISA